MATAREISVGDLSELFLRLKNAGYAIIGPTVRDGAIQYRELSSPSDLPRGVVDVQGPGTYQLRQTSAQAHFSYNLGPDSWRSHLLPKTQRIFSGTKGEDGFTLERDEPAPRKLAFFGIRPCELKAIDIQDKVFTKSQYTQPHYKSQRDQVLNIAVNCTTAAATCFCPSFGINAEATSGFDIALTEVCDADRHFFVVDTGSPIGEELMRGLARDGRPDTIASKRKSIDGALAAISRRVDEKKAAKDLRENKNHPHWDRIAERCLSCANCTLVCPTCFCSTVRDTTDLSGDHTERWLTWDSCFNGDHSYIHDNNVHGSTKSRYRQWLTHKISSWYDQFGSSGCVGCGRCIAWCPAGIDLTEEVKHFAAEDSPA